MSLPATLLLTFVVSLAVSAWLGWRRHAVWQDQPGERSLHQEPVPRSGGIAIWAGVLTGAVCTIPHWIDLFDPWLLLAAFMLGAVAIWDDVRTVSAGIRLLVQCVASLLAVVGAGLCLHFWGNPFVWVIVSLLAFLWGINLYNFMDGMDGFAGGMAVFGFGGLSIMGYWYGDMAFALVSGFVVAASLGFLVVNFPPAKLFMGDSGSTLLGFAMVSLGILGWKRGIYPVWAPLILFSPFWVDASVTLIKRAWRKEKLWQAHRQHYYQRWVLAGFSHRRVVLIEYLLMAACLLIVLAWQTNNAGYNEGRLVVLWIVFYGLAIAGSEGFFRKTLQ